MSKKQEVLVSFVLSAVFISVVFSLFLVGSSSVSLKNSSGNSLFFSGSNSTNTTINSSRFFLGPIGTEMNAGFIQSLSNLSVQLAEVGQEQLAGNLTCFTGTAATSANPAAPGYCALVMPDNNYDLVPIPVKSSAGSLTENGKPTMMYLGAQGCPYCALERYAMVIALSRFGNFTQLFYDRSATNDGNIPTFTFNFSASAFASAMALPAIIGNGSAVAPGGDGQATGFFVGNYYSSPYINFLSFDQVGSSYFTNPTVLSTYLPSNFTGPATVGFGITYFPNYPQYGVPFFDVNNQYVFDGAILNPNIVFRDLSAFTSQSNMTASLQTPSKDSFGETALGAANILTADICVVIKNAAPVCSLAYISALENEVKNAQTGAASSSSPFPWLYVYVGIAAAAAILAFLFLRKSGGKANSKSEAGLAEELKRLREEIEQLKQTENKVTETERKEEKLEHVERAEIKRLDRQSSEAESELEKLKRENDELKRKLALDEMNKHAYHDDDNLEK